jgi:hypothetical protein
MNWLVTYTTDYNATQQTQTVNAPTFTTALLNFMLLNINNAIALEIKKI